MIYLQKAWGDPIENPTLADIRTAISEMKQMDEEHGAFWMVTEDEEMILEVQKDLRVTLIICGEICREAQCASAKQAEELFSRLIAGEYETVKDEFECL